MKHKIFSHTSLLIILSVILTFLAAGTVMYNRYDIYMKQGVRDEAAYIKTGLEEDGRDFLTDKIGDATSSRITLLGKDGDVLFDSIENPSEMENHSNRPEFIEAEKKGFGEMVRYSDTLSKQTFYYAIKLKDDQVLRVARTTDSLLMTMLSSFLLLGGLVCVIFVIEFFLVQNQTQKLIEPINQINLEKPLDNVCYEELRPLLFRLDQQNRQIKKQLEDLKNAESARKEFTANVSHELKTPLMSISGYAELMMNGMVPPDKMQDFSGRIFHESERLSNLVADIIQLSIVCPPESRCHSVFLRIVFSGNTSIRNALLCLCGSSLAKRCCPIFLSIFFPCCHKPSLPAFEIQIIDVVDLQIFLDLFRDCRILVDSGILNDCFRIIYTKITFFHLLHNFFQCVIIADFTLCKLGREVCREWCISFRACIARRFLCTFL